MSFGRGIAITDSFCYSDEFFLSISGTNQAGALLYFLRFWGGVECPLFCMEYWNTAFVG